jgi:hypothetical protein
MKRIKLVVLSLAALVFGRPAGFCTANTESKQLEDYTVEELKEIAAKYKAEITADMKKADLVAAIKKSAGYKAPEPSLEERLAKLEAENAEMKRQLSLPPVLDPSPPDGPLAMLCRGAGVDIADVRWRMQAGLDGEQAVEAALAQKRHDESPESEKLDAENERRRAETKKAAAK